MSRQQHSEKGISNKIKSHSGKNVPNNRRRLKQSFKNELSLKRKRNNGVSDENVVIVDDKTTDINTEISHVNNEKCDTPVSVHFSSTHVMSHDNLCALEIASDYNEIQKICMINMMELEKDQSEDKFRGSSLYVACREIEERKKCTSGAIKDVREFVPYNIIRAMDMLDAIKCYEGENGKKSWVPITDRQVFQKGFDKGSTVRQNSTVLIFKIQRDCCLVSEKAKNDTRSSFIGEKNRNFR